MITKAPLPSMDNNMLAVTSAINTIAGSNGHNARPYKVLFVIDTLQTGGAEQSLLANVIRFKNMQPVVCHLYAGDQLKQQFIDHGINVHSVSLKKKYGFPQAYKKL